MMNRKKIRYIILELTHSVIDGAREKDIVSVLGDDTPNTAPTLKCRGC
ncbi:hypothetical protein IC620_16040 [Hazenella sp. IB182357]|uniref:Uncharacterized protein n=1 Tax=Polycladospora coralii TaxID=2771432 RepID=A0A926N897_9BACL|nr:hypothetical protein [Polycladospora coralii]MBD1373856.1 hypothetical protein [Polycladospora coralii]